MDHDKNAALRVELPEASAGSFGRWPFVGTHNLDQLDLFSDEALGELIDRYPREHLYALTMGNDPTRPYDNRLALHDGVSGAELLRAVANGRLWLNITQVDRVDTRYRALVDQLYEQLAGQVPGFVPLRTQATLLISSPHALVHYHADAPASALWHIRGHKRIWIYPALAERYMKRELLEDVFAGVRHEYLPYEHAFDEAAVCYELGPGQWASWPQNAPHRVTNQDSVNVSLSTEHFSAAARRRQRVYLANRFFRTRLGAKHFSARETGVAAWTKTTMHRVANKLGLDPLQLRRHVPVLRVSADAPGGVVPLAGVSDPPAGST